MVPAELCFKNIVYINIIIDNLENMIKNQNINLKKYDIKYLKSMLEYLKTKYDELNDTKYNNEGKIDIYRNFVNPKKENIILKIESLIIKFDITAKLIKEYESIIDENLKSMNFNYYSFII